MSDTVTVEVFHTIRGDRRHDQAAARACEVRHDVARGDQHLNAYDFAMCYDRVGVEELAFEGSDECVQELVNRVVDRWSTTPAHVDDGTADAYEPAEMRSMEVGDIIMIDGDPWMVEPVGVSPRPHLRDRARDKRAGPGDVIDE